MFWWKNVHCVFVNYFFNVFIKIIKTKRIITIYFLFWRNNLLIGFWASSEPNPPTRTKPPYFIPRISITCEKLLSDLPSEMHSYQTALPHHPTPHWLNYLQKIRQDGKDSSNTRFPLSCVESNFFVCLLFAIDHMSFFVAWCYLPSMRHHSFVLTNYRSLFLSVHRSAAVKRHSSSAGSLASFRRGRKLQVQWEMNLPLELLEMSRRMFEEQLINYRGWIYVWKENFRRTRSCFGIRRWRCFVLNTCHCTERKKKI